MLEDNSRQGTDGDEVDRSTSRKSGSGTTTGKATLMAAVVAQDMKAAEAALKNGVDVNLVDDHGWTPLRKAARSGDMNMVGLLLENGANVRLNEQVVVLTAASWGRADVLKLLLEARADVGPESSWEVTPLIAAAQHGHTRIMNVLLEFEADVNQEDNSGNDPLMTAWEANRSDIVLFLVEHGAILKKESDWVRLASSPITAAQTAEGIHRRNVRRIQEAELQGIANAETYFPGVTLPIKAFCRWVEMVPKAAVTLLDKVLLQTPKDAPIRAEMGGVSIRTKYVPINVWATKEEPDLLCLAPKDTDNSASVVNTLVLHQKGIVDSDVLFSLARSDSYMFKSFAVQCLLHHCWTHQSYARHMMDVVLELVTLLSLLIWTFADDNGESRLPLFAISMCFLFIAGVADLFIEMRQFSYFTRVGVGKEYFNNFRASTGASASRYIRLSTSFLTVLLALAIQPWADDYTTLDTGIVQQLFDAMLSSAVFVRWMVLLSHFRVFEFSGPKLIPITNTVSHVGRFVLTIGFTLASFWHASSILKTASAKDVFLLQLRLILLRDFDYEEYTAGTFYWLQVVVFLASSFLAVVMLNVFIAMIIESYEFQQELSVNHFTQQRTHLCLQYFLCMEGGSMAPLDNILQKIIPNVFVRPREDAYLWICHEVDDDDQNSHRDVGLHVTKGRIGWIKETIRGSLNSSFKKSNEEILDLEENLKRRWLLVNRELKLLKTEVTKNMEAAIKELSTKAEDANVAKKDDYSPDDELEVVQEGSDSD
eukprot:GEMP01014372.1.p1 GENE.GEMP01014372.1~~GEMP01014372.1.p1  ORF type:complete len:766 (+),score=161.60 GEMP01014372.1:104-2401(+)